MINRLYLYILCVLVYLPGGCSVPEPRNVAVNDLDNVNPKEIIEKEKRIRPLGPPSFSEKLQPVAKGLIKDQKLYALVFENAPLGSVLSALNKDSGLNLSVEAAIDLARPITVNLKQATFEEALDMVVEKGAGYAWKIEDNNLDIKRFKERIYQFDYLDLVGETNIDIGGDMLASGVENAGVSGKFQITGERDKEHTDVWKGIQEALDVLKSSEGLLRIDRNAGIIYLLDTPKNIDSMVSFLDAVSESLHRQVFIEAKIMEVQLSDKNTLGIDWTSLNVAFKSDSGMWPDVFDFSFNTDGSITLANQSSITGMLDFLRTQGEITVLSNPHLSLMNGQSALMTVGFQFPYGDVDGVDRDAESGLVTYGVSIKRAVLGLQLGITVQISGDGLIALHVVPTVTRIQREEDVELPTTTTTASTISNPVIDLQELSTMVRVRDGQSVVLGGLISQIKNLDHESLPWISGIPFIGSLFKHMEDTVENKELVIFITPYIKEIS
jgi:MSHA biogenesis protein MshL